MEQQSKDTLRQGELDFGQPAPWVRPLEQARGGIPRAGTQRERQVFAAWREELDWKERLLERVADPANLEAACQRVVGNKGAAGVDGMTVLQLRQ